MATGKDEKVHKEPPLKSFLVFGVVALALFIISQTHLPRYMEDVTKSMLSGEKLLYEVKSNLPRATNVDATRILFGEISMGNDPLESFVKLYNPGNTTIDLTGFSIKKLSTDGKETTFLSAKKFENISVNPHEYLLLAKASSTMSADVYWPKSYNFARSNSSLFLYNPSGERVDEVSWKSIPQNMSLVRIAWDNNEFTLLNPQK